MVDRAHESLMSVMSYFFVLQVVDIVRRDVPFACCERLNVSIYLEVLKCSSCADMSLIDLDFGGGSTIPPKAAPAVQVSDIAVAAALVDLLT